MPYCQHCGKKLEDGEACTCAMAQAAASQPPQSEQPPAAPPAVSRVSVVFKKFKQYIASYVSNPEQAVRSAMAKESDLTLPVLFTVIRLLAVGLAIYGLLRKLCAIAFSFITTSILRYSGSSGNLLTASLTASLFKSLIFGALIAAAGMLLFIAMLFALVKIQHGKAAFLDVFKASAANGLPASALLLLSFLFSFFSPVLGMVFLALAMLVWIISGVRTAQIVSPNSSTGMFWLLYFVGVVLILVIGCYLVPPLFGQAAGGITASYMGESVALQDVFDNMFSGLNQQLAEEGISGWREFFSMAMKQFFVEFSDDLWHNIVSTFN